VRQSGHQSGVSTTNDRYPGQGCSPLVTPFQIVVSTYCTAICPGSETHLHHTDTAAITETVRASQHSTNSRPCENLLTTSATIMNVESTGHCFSVDISLRRMPVTAHCAYPSPRTNDPFAATSSSIDCHPSCCAIKRTSSSASSHLGRVAVFGRFHVCELASDGEGAGTSGRRVDCESLMVACILVGAFMGTATAAGGQAGGVQMTHKSSAGTLAFGQSLWFECPCSNQYCNENRFSLCSCNVDVCSCSCHNSAQTKVPGGATLQLRPSKASP
jgi:hypothetical protein